MGIYIFKADVLIKALEDDAGNMDSQHDFGRNILPSLFRTRPVYAYRFYDENKKDAKYWRDIGTLDAYYEASMDLCQVSPEFNLYDPGVAAAHLPAAGAAGEVRVRPRRRALRPGARLDRVERLHRLGQHGHRQHPVPQRPGPQLLRPSSSRS